MYWFCHISKWIHHRCTCVPHPDPPPSSLPIPSLWVVPVYQPQASSIVHGTWTGDSFHIWYYTCFKPFSKIIQPCPSPTESKRLFYTSVSLLLSRIQDYCYLSKFHIYVRQQKLRAGALGWTWGMGWGGSRMGSLLPYF